MRWEELLQEFKKVGSNDATAEVSGVQYDSRRVGAGDVFVAMRGGTSDGNRFVDAALKQGAAAVVTDSPEVFGKLCVMEVPVALVEHGRRALAEVSAAVFGHPERVLKVSAVTGTNGKTTTAFLLQQMLRSVGRKVVLIGTIETRIGDEVRESAHTTPESRDLYEIFAEGVKAGCTEVVMEMSSHALEQERVWGVPVDVAMFTNLTQDHLDYHGTMDEYFAAKEKMFHGVGAHAPRVAVVNEDDRWGSERLAYSVKSPTELQLYGLEAGPAGYRSEDVVLRAGETAFQWVTPQGGFAVVTPLTGKVNLYNWLAAACAALARGLSVDEVVSASAKLDAAPGRFEVVQGSRETGFVVVVDYAHTDDALKNLIVLARDLVGDGRVITMFGCGGDRDRTKRPKMGRVAAEGSDVVVVTSDNPRSEDPMAIVEEVMVGVREAGRDAVIELDRHRAIELAIREARPGDIVLLAGKGHEKTQTFADRTVAFDDVAVAAEVLRGLR